MKNKTEMLDLVDENDKVIEVLSRDKIYANNLKYVRVVEAFIYNSDGKIWIPIRHDKKRIAPGGFDVGVGGHVEHGETYLDAFRKETQEELGWDIESMNYHRVGKFGPKDGLNTVSMLYEINTDLTPQLNSDDFVSAQWLTPQEVADKIKSGHKAKSNLLTLLELVYKTK